MNEEIKLIITDFDGTLVDTFEANLCAYQEAFASCGLQLHVGFYRQCFGLRFEVFMEKAGITDSSVCHRIKEKKVQVYPHYFDRLKPNLALIHFLKSCKQSGIQIAIASTAHNINLLNVLRYLGIADFFDFILSGVDVARGKPAPDIYIKALEVAHVDASQALVFEDSEVGFRAVEKAGLKYIKINPEFYGN